MFGTFGMFKCFYGLDLYYNLGFELHVQNDHDF